MKRFLMLFLALTMLFIFSAVSHAVTYTWTTLDYPGAVRTRPLGVDGSNIVGYYNDGSSQHGFIAILSTTANPVSTGTNVSVMPTANINMTFDNVTTEGTLTVTELSNPSPPANFRFPSGKSFEITFDGVFSGNVEVCFTYNDADVQGNENKLKLMHRTNTGWQDITTSLDTTNNIICEVTSSFSEFAVMEPLASDTTPDQFTFTSDTNAPLNTLVMSELITITGIDTPSPIAITGGKYSLSGGAFTTPGGTVNNGDSIRVLFTSSVDYATTTSATVTIGGVSGTFSVTTREYNSPPPVLPPEQCASGSNPRAAGSITVNGLRTTNATVGSTVILTDDSSSDGSLYINWGDGTPMVSPKSSPASVLGGANEHIYSHLGKYRVTQTVANACGYKAQQIYTVTLGTHGKGTLLISASGNAHFNIGYKVIKGRTTVTNGSIAVGESKSITLEANTYSVTFTYQSKNPLTEPLQYYHSCSTLPSGAVTSVDGSSVRVGSVTVPAGEPASVSLSDCND